MSRATGFRVHRLIFLLLAALAASVAVVSPPGLPTLSASATTWNGSITKWSATRPIVDSNDSRTTLSISLSDSLYGTGLRTVIYDSRNALVRDCTYPYITGCAADVQIPFQQTVTYTAYVSEDAPVTGPPLAIHLASDPLTVTHAGWLGSITKFTAAPAQVDSNNSLTKLSLLSYGECTAWGSGPAVE